MDEQYHGMPETDWLMMELDNVLMRTSIERAGDDILVCDNLDGDEISDGLKFTHEQEDPIGTETKEKTIRELMNEELDVSKEMELLKKTYKKHKKEIGGTNNLKDVLNSYAEFPLLKMRSKLFSAPIMPGKPEYYFGGNSYA